METFKKRGRSGRLVALAIEQSRNEENSKLEISESSLSSDYIPSESDSISTSANESQISNRSFSPEIPIQPPIIVSYSETNPINSPSTQLAEVSDFRTKYNKTRRIRRKHKCTYCDILVGNFVRHLERHHHDETEVAKFMSLDKNSKTRKKIVDKLRKEGDFCSSDIVPVKVVADKSLTDYIACKFCRGYYTKNSLRRHTKKCFFNPDPSKRLNSQIEGQNIMAGIFGPNDVLRLTGLLDMMRADDISLVAKKDPIICEIARRYIKSHKEKHLLLVAKRKMRRLARLLISARKIENKCFPLLDILTPTKFQLLIRATKEITEYQETERTFKSASLALQMGTLSKDAINTAYSMLIQKGNETSDFLQKLNALKTLIETDWANEISTEAAQNFAINKFNKPMLIPTAQDIMKFDQYLKKVIIEEKLNLVIDSKNIKSYRCLMEAVFCKLLLLNRRRVGELQRITLSCYFENSKIAETSDFEKVLTESEKILNKNLKRIVIRGKHGRGVPVLIERQIQESIDFAITIRDNFNLEQNIYLFGVPRTQNPLCGNAVMCKSAKQAFNDASKARLLTSTKLRKHLATIIQILNMEKTELQQLATFLGHTEKTHCEFYRLPDDIYQTAKVSKILLLSKTNSIEKFKGQSLSTLNIDGTLIEEEQNTFDEEEIDVSFTEKSDETKSIEDVCKDKPLKVKKGLKRTLVPWTTTQKKLTEDFFKRHIKHRIPPKKHEVIELANKNPDIFENKSWQVIKVYVTNKFCKT